MALRILNLDYAETLDYADVDLQAEIDQYNRECAKRESKERVRKARAILRAKVRKRRGFAGRSWRCLRLRS